MTRHGTAAHLSLYAMLLVGCGTPGAPQPPSLRLPKPVADLNAVRVGDRVHLAWTPPKVTTDGGSVTGPSKSNICRSFSGSGSANCREGSQAGEFSDEINELQANPQGHDFVNYTVEVLNDRGRSAGVSNVATVFLAASVTQPKGLMAAPGSDVVALRWSPVEAPLAQRMPTRFSLRVLRGAAAGAQTVLGELPINSSSFADSTFDWEKNYSYVVVGVTQVLSSDGKVLYEFQGESSDPALVTTHDTFPPAVPANVQAVFSGGLDPRQNYIDVTWSPAQERDLAGYIVYRSNGGAPVRLNAELLKVPALRDDKIAAGKTYIYTVSAVDERGNESARSQPASESVPQQP